MRFVRFCVATAGIILFCLTGCSSPAPLPEKPPTTVPVTADRPVEPVSAEAPPAGTSAPQTGCLFAISGGQPWGKISNPQVGTFVKAGECEAKVPSDSLAVTFHVPPSTTEKEAHAALQLTGPQEPEIRLSRTSQQMSIALLYPSGAPGDRLVAGLEGPVGEGGAPVSMRFVMERVESPRIQATWRPEGGTDWRSFDPTRTVPSGPLQVRLQLPAGIDKEALLQQIGIGAGGASYTVATPEPQSLVIDLPTPEPHHLFRFGDIGTAYRLHTRDSLLEFFTGEPARLVALDPANGQEQVVGEVPPNVSRARLDPHGKLVALWAMGDDLYSHDLWIMNHRSGDLLRIHLAFIPKLAFWTERGLVLPTPNQVFTFHRETGRTEGHPSQGVFWNAISPDNRYLAGFNYDDRKVDQAGLAPVTIVLHDLAAGEERLFPGVTKIVVPRSHAPLTLPMSFTADGLGLDIHEPLSSDRTTQGTYPERLVRLDLRTDELSEPGPLLYGEPTSDWHPDPQDQFAYSRSPGWDQVLIRTPAGETKHYGTGLVIGWRQDGRLLVLRWANLEYRRGPEGP